MTSKLYTYSKRGVYVVLSLFAVVVLVDALIPLFGIGLFPEWSGNPLEGQEQLTQTMAWWINAGQLAGLLALGAFVVLAVWALGASRVLRDVESGSGVINEWLALALCLIPGLNLVGCPFVLYRLLSVGERAVGEWAEWFRFRGRHLVAATSVVLAATLGVSAYSIFVVGVSMDSASDMTLLVGLNTLSGGLDVILAGLSAAIVHRVDQLQSRISRAPEVAEVFE